MLNSQWCLQMTSRQDRAPRPVMPFDLEAVISSYSPDDQASIRRSVRQLNEGVPVDTVMSGLERRLMSPVAMAIIEGAVISNVSANNLMLHLGLTNMTAEEEQEFGYTGGSSTSVGLLPPTTQSTMVLARYLSTLVTGQLPDQVRLEACSYSPEEQAYIRHGFGRLRAGTPVGVIAEEPRSHLIGIFVVSLIEHGLEAGVPMTRTLARLGMPPFTEDEIMNLRRDQSRRSGEGAAGGGQ